MAEILSTITELGVDEIDMGDRLRPVSPAGVEALKASIRELGVIKDAIHVRKIKKGGKIVLLAGGHRLTAARELRDEGMPGFDTVKVVCWSCTDDFAQLIEIDDNLAGAELTPLDTAVFLARRKEVYERLHPEMAQGGFRGNQHTGNLVPDIMSMTTSAAEKFGITERHVRRLVAAGNAIRGDAHRLRKAPKPITLNDLMQISKIATPTERYFVIDALAEGRTKNAASARAHFRESEGKGPSLPSPVEQQSTRLSDAWTRASKAARDKFFERYRDEIAAHLDRFDAEGGE